MKKNIFELEHYKIINIFLIIYDIIAVNLSYFLALLIRFDFRFSLIGKEYLYSFYKFAPYYTAVCIIVFVLCKLYNSIWRFASYNELLRVLIATFITCLIQIAGTLLFIRRMPISYYMMGIVFQFIFVLGIRFSYRFILMLRAAGKDIENTSRVMVIGAGEAGQMIIRDVNNLKHTGDKAVCIIDDNTNKWNRYVDGVKVVGGRESIIEKAKEFNINKILIAIPSAPASTIKEIASICQETDCEVKIIPSLYKFVENNLTIDSVRDISVEDLLGRDPVEIDMDEVFNSIKNKTILVTGGGGSIGSELCRQIALHSPKKLIIFDIYENNAYEIQLELRERFPNLDCETLIGSVRDTRKVIELFKKYKPDIVYHAAAHKHVPLMEDSPCEAIKNNVLGTYNCAYAAALVNTERFVLISTDKAVNPTNVMGASKRLCEMVIQSFATKVNGKKKGDLSKLLDLNDKLPENIKTVYTAVRFGNVLGSNGSVVPIFKKQISNGGPVTVTDPEMVRYFMTIPEAVSLVLQAGVYAKGGEIFVLDMGEPVKIDTLARNLIKLAGYKPDVDIKIVYTGLRPGEKMYEERLMDEEGLETTPNKLISIGKPISFDLDVFIPRLKELIAKADLNDSDIEKSIKELVPTYKEVK